MSHSPERKEKICLNCNATIYGRYCHVCGQENIEPKESFWGLVTHFVYDITHFDGKFFSTLKYLLLRPGFLSHEYLRGKRASYLNPIRMYVFTSAFFFVIFFSFVANHNETANVSPGESDFAVDSSKPGNEQADEIALKKMRTVQNENFSVVMGDSLPATTSTYDSLQKKLPEVKRDNWLVKFFKKRAILINAKYHGNGKEFSEKFGEKFLHAIPQIMFLSLPFVALLLKLLYVRHKNIYYVNHLIFSVHTYIAIYILILFTYLFTFMNSISGWRIFNWLGTITVFVIFFYIYKALRNFYRQRRAKTVIKFLLLNFLYIFIIVLLFIVFGITTFLQV